MNKKEFKVSESILTLSISLKHCSEAFFLCFYHMLSLYILPLCYTVWKVVKRGVVGAKNH